MTVRALAADLDRGRSTVGERVRRLVELRVIVPMERLVEQIADSLEVRELLRPSIAGEERGA